MPIVARAPSPSGPSPMATPKKAKRRSLFGLGRKQSASDATEQPPLPAAASPSAASFAAASSSAPGADASPQDAWKAERNAGEQSEWQLEQARGRAHEEERQRQMLQYEASQRRGADASASAGRIASGSYTRRVEEPADGNERAYVGYDEESEEEAQLAYSTAPEQHGEGHFTFPSRSASYDEVSYAAAASYGYAPRPRQGSAPAAGLRHERARSHFSIPDVVVTACEEEGEVSRVELAVPVQKRRSFVFTHILPSAAGHVLNGAAYDYDRGMTVSPTSTAPRKAKLQKPKPLIRLDSDGRGGTLPTMGTLPGSGAEDPPYSPTTTSPTSSPASSWGKGAGSAAAAGAAQKRTRKSSFPSIIFGKRDKSAPADEMPPDAARAAALAQQELDAAPAARSATPVQRTSGSSSLPSPPDTPNGLRVARAQSKKLAKAREKEESALMRELEKVNKMVRAHDAKVDKVRAKEAKRKTLLLAKESVVPPELRGASPTPTQQPGAAVKALRRITMFSAGNKSGTATPGVQLVRKNSALRRAPGAAAVSGNTTPTKPKARDEARWAAVRESPPRAKRAAAGSDESERSSATTTRTSSASGGAQEWADVPSPTLSSMPSLAHPNGTPAAPAAGAGVQRKSSIQRALAMSEAESAMIRRKTSLNRRGSQSRLNSAGTGATTPKHRGSPNGSLSGMNGVVRKRSLVRRDREGEADRQMGWEEEVEAGLERVRSGQDDGAATPRAADYARKEPTPPPRRTTDAAKASAAAQAAAAIGAGSAPRLPNPLSGRITPSFGERFEDASDGRSSPSPLSFSRPFRAGEADSQPTPTVTITSPPHSPVSPVSPGARLPGGHPSGFTFPPRPPREQRRAGTLPGAGGPASPPPMSRSESVPQLHE